MDEETKSAAALLGKRGGHATARKMTAAQRKARARLGGLARQKKRAQRVTEPNTSEDKLKV